MTDTPGLTVLTIGHSNHPYARFLELLRRAGVTAVADVRSAPWSRHTPQFNAKALKARLPDDGIAYSVLGRELGGRPEDPALYEDGVADYQRMAATASFKAGLARVIDGAARYRIALMCSEQDPLDCHRCLLVGRALAARGVRVGHILADGRIAGHEEIEQRLLTLAKRAEADLFEPPAARLAASYRVRGRKVAFAEPVAEDAPAPAVQRRKAAP